MSDRIIKTLGYKHSRGTTKIVIGNVDPTQYLNGIDYTCSSVLIVTSRKVYALWKSKLEKLFAAVHPQIIVLPNGEKAKDGLQLQKIYSRMLKMGMDRKGLVVAFGGGTISDVAGYAASTYMRGIRYIIIPTTLLSQADAAIGGKNGINYDGVKNLVGSFYHPDYVFVNTCYLSTLPKREYISGLAEILKCAFLNGYKAVESFTRYISSRSDSMLFSQIVNAIKTKVDLIKLDPYDRKNKRILLNYGHTIGHAIESANHLNEIKHGESVALGIIAASYISYKAGQITNRMLYTTIDIIKRAGLPICFSGINIEHLTNFIKYDKKMLSSNISMLLPLGSRIKIKHVSYAAIKHALIDLQNGVLDGNNKTDNPPRAEDNALLLSTAKGQSNINPTQNKDTNTKRMVISGRRFMS